MIWLRSILEADPRNVYIIAVRVSSALPSTPDMDASAVVRSVS